MKKRIRHYCSFLLERFAYFSGLNELLYFLNRKAKRVLTFHHVFPDEMMKHVRMDTLVNSLSSFEKIIEHLQKRYTFSLDLNDPKSVTLTFDDGYQSQYEIAAKALYKKDIPAYLFVAGQLMEPQNKVPLNVDMMTAWIALAPDGEYELNYKNEKKRFNLMSKNRLEILIQLANPLFFSEGDSCGVVLVNALNKCYPFSKILKTLPSDYCRLRFDAVSPAMLDDLKAHGWAIGAHGYSHYAFGSFSSEACESDIRASYKALEKWKNTDVYSYPFGGPATVGEIAPIALEKLDAVCGLVNIVIPGWSETCYTFPRMTVSANKYAFHFELSGCKYFFRHFKLLPVIKI